MTAHVFSAATFGFDGKLIDVECDASNSLPNLVIVGLGNKAIDEARERVRSAIKNSHLDFPRKRVTINLAPASLPKDGSHFDLPIAMAILAVSGQLTQKQLADTLIVGELALDGSLRPIRGIINHVQTAQMAGLKRVLIPTENCAQASLVEGIDIIGVKTLRAAYEFVTGITPAAPYRQSAANDAPSGIVRRHQVSATITFADIYGQEQAKRALVIAAAGHHNILLTGPPGAGKTMLARSLLSILPPLSNQEVVEVTKLHSLAGQTTESVIYDRPFRSPHHSASYAAMVGGGSNPKPGEISLAHRGVLFLDELPEYNRQSLESLRQPLEDKQIHLTRGNHRASYPANFMLVATQNPCPCGHAGDQSRTCTCEPQKILRYQNKISGPLLDRIDIVLAVSSIEHTRLLEENNTDDKNTTLSASQVLAARQLQHRRYASPQAANSQLSGKDIKTIANLNPKAKNLLDTAAHKLNISTRSYFKAIKVARTIADLENSEYILAEHIAESLQYRPRQGP